MSLDLYVQWFRDGSADSVDETRVREIFGDALDAEHDWGWQLDYGRDADVDVYVRPRAGRIEALTINRPVESSALWQAVFDLLALEQAVFYFPGSPPYIRSASVAAHLPREMVDALGTPQIVTSAAALKREVSE